MSRESELDVDTMVLAQMKGTINDLQEIIEKYEALLQAKDRLIEHLRERVSQLGGGLA